MTGMLSVCGESPQALYSLLCLKYVLKILLQIDSSITHTNYRYLLRRINFQPVRRRNEAVYAPLRSALNKRPLDI